MQTIFKDMKPGSEIARLGFQNIIPNLDENLSQDISNDYSIRF